jgi:hypothetical protein
MNKVDALSIKYIATADFTSVTNKQFKKGEYVPNGDATSMMKYLKVVDMNESPEEATKDIIAEPEIIPENKVMTTKDLKTKTKK